MVIIRNIIIGLFSCIAWSQETVIKGRFVDHNQQPISRVKIEISPLNTAVYSDQEGDFTLAISAITSSTLALLVSHTDFETLQIPITIKEGIVSIGEWQLSPVVDIINELPIVDFENDPSSFLEESSPRFGGQLRSRRTVFLEALSFQFSSAFFSARGLARKHQLIRINGIPMQNFDNGNASWSHWGGLNDMTNRSQTVQFGLAPLGDYFGGILGGVEIFIRPSSFRKGSKFSQAFSNRTYRYRSMFSTHTGRLKSDWSLSALASFRKGDSGYVEGTSYQAISGLFSVEKIWNDQHASWLTAWWTPTSRGRNAPLTQEVFRLKGKQYNPYWGKDQGRLRNARMYRSSVPYFILNHSVDFSDKASLLFSTAYSNGQEGNSRLSYTGVTPLEEGFIGGGRNPDPVYYQNLPSYFLRNPANQDLAKAYLATNNLKDKGQIDWLSLRFANASQGENYARYAVYEDVKQENKSAFSVRLFFDPSAEEFWNTSFSYQKSAATYSAMPTDFLGAKMWYDINPYAEDEVTQKNDLQRTVHSIGLEQAFQYHYKIQTTAYEANTLWSKEVKNWRLYLGGKIQLREYQREGLFQNGGFAENSLGLSTPVRFQTWDAKGGIQWAITGRHFLSLNGFIFQTPPSLRSVFPNPRENNLVIPDLKPENSLGLTGQYNWQTLHLDFMLRGYWIKQRDLNAVSFYFADGVGGDEAFFIQEVLQGIQSQHQGVELGMKLTLADLIDIKAVGAFGLHQYLNSPDLLLYTAPTTTALEEGFVNGVKNFGAANLKGYYLANGPQQAYSLGIQYNDPAYWRLSVTGNYFSHAYLQPNPLKRTQSFLLDAAGLPIQDYDVAAYQSLLKQERFPAYFVLNASLGKSWKVKQNYFGFFATFENLLDATYKTGGFEQGRNANYYNALEDRQRATSLFSPKYWWGRGTTFFTSFYYRF
jgi:hypothetical protein